jgi:hypothetical protein
VPLPAAVVDAEGLWKTWITAQTDVVGPGKPLTRGAFITTRAGVRSPNNGAWAVISRIGGDQTWTAETDNDRARLSASIFGATRHLATLAANAYVNKLLQVSRLGGVLVADGIRLQTVDAISGPLYIPGGSKAEQLLVDADFYFVPVP